MEAAVAATRRALPSTPFLAAALGLAVVAGAVLRFSQLDLQGYWFDEAYTVEIVGDGLRHVVDTVPETEFTPPLYYLSAWAWVGVFGIDEPGLRSLSALCGVLTVVVVYFAGRNLVDVRTGVAAAALCAVSPALVWYSQEARSYSMLALACALTLLFLSIDLRAPGDRRALVGWAIAAGAALATHYFAVFLIVPQALWLLWRRRDRAAAVAVAAVGAVGAALLVLAVNQKETALLGFLEQTPLDLRFEGAAKGIAGGVFADNPEDRFPIELALALAAIALLLAVGLRRLEGRARAGAALALGLSAVAIGVPMVAAPLGFDYVVLRNFVGVLPVLCVAMAAGLMAPGAIRVGVPILAALVVVSLVATDRARSDEGLHRTDWREIDAALGPGDPGRVMIGYWASQPTLEAYRDTTPLQLPQLLAMKIEELVLLFPEELSIAAPPEGGFVARPAEGLEGYRILRFRADRPRVLTPEQFTGLGLSGPLMLDRPDGRRALDDFEPAPAE